MQLIISGIILIMIDFIYLSLTLPTFKNMVKQIQKSPVIVRPGGVVVSYILPILGLNMFILKDNKSPIEAGLLGFIMYGVFDAVNYTLFTKYNLKLAIIDTLWGATLFYITTYLTYLFQNNSLYNI